MRDYFEEIAWHKEYELPKPDPKTEIVVVIPSYKEKSLGATLISLAGCYKPDIPTEVLVVINGRSDDSEETRQTNQSTFISDKKIKQFICHFSKLAKNLTK